MDTRRIEITHGTLNGLHQGVGTGGPGRGKKSSFITPKLPCTVELRNPVLSFQAGGSNALVMFEASLKNCKPIQCLKKKKTSLRARHFNSVSN